MRHADEPGIVPGPKLGSIRVAVYEMEPCGPVIALAGETLIFLGLMPWALMTPLVITRLFKPWRSRDSESPPPEAHGEYTGDSFTYQYYQAGRWLKRWFRPALWSSFVCIVAGGLVLLVDR